MPSGYILKKEKKKAMKRIGNCVRGSCSCSSKFQNDKAPISASTGGGGYHSGLAPMVTLLSREDAGEDDQLGGNFLKRNKVDTQGFLNKDVEGPG